jgi:CHAT domain-containing protein
LKAVQSPRVLHLATHGFFLSDQEFQRTNYGRADLLVGLDARQLVPTKGDWENPLVRCGIALAGANHFTNWFFGGASVPASRLVSSLAPPIEANGAHGVTRPTWDVEDGLLTGLEASLLNLQGTELVILSACQTGEGEVKIGEGVMSLRRAFRIAGAETVLASHWKVSDQATSQLMTEFMRRWRGGEPRAKAWREAQLSLLRSKEFSNPYFWAAFTLTGQWN